MKAGLAVLAVFLFLGCVGEQSRNAEIEAYFCPEEKCAAKLVESFDAASYSIDVAIYSLTDDEIAAALIRAKSRGVNVRVLMDSLQASNAYSDDETLAENGVAVKLAEKERGIMHNKFAVIDSAIVATGSFNYSKNAREFNNENLVFLYDAGTAYDFAREFELLWKAS